MTDARRAARGNSRRSSILCVSIALGVLLVGCGGGGESGQAVVATRSDVAPTEVLRRPTLPSAAWSLTPGEHVATDATQWQAVWAQMQQDGAAAPVPQGVDFRQDMVLAVTAVGMDGCSQLNITDVSPTKTGWRVHYRVTSHGGQQGVMCTDEAPALADAVLWPRSEGTVEFSRD